MSEQLVLEPDAIQDRSVDVSALPEWLASFARYAMDAAAAGEMVNVTSHLAALTPAQVAYRLNVSRPTITRRIEAGEIAAIKVGSHHRIPYNEFIRYRNTLMVAMVQQITDDLDDDLAAP